MKPSALNRLDLSSLDLSAFRGATALVVGDLILDHYLWGAARRITPEAPVPVILRERDSWALGGAANVAHNIQSLGGKPVLLGRIGRDEAGSRFEEALQENGMSRTGLIRDAHRPTTLKTRVVSMGQQVLRLDWEERSPLDGKQRETLLRKADKALEKCRVVILSDYGKGLLDRELIQALLRRARAKNRPVLVDPKGKDYSKYKGVDILTPNQKEASLASGLEIHDEEGLKKAGRKLLRQSELKALLVTRGPEGLALLRPRQSVLTIPARAREVFDVTGAGDSTIACLALGLSAGFSLEQAAALANHAGGVAVGKLGVATVSPEELRHAITGASAEHKIRSLSELKQLVANAQARSRKVVFTNGCFDLLHAGHIHFLHAARAQGDLLVVGLNSDASVHHIKGDGRPILPFSERSAILAALEVVDYVIPFEEDTPHHLLEALRPDVLVKGENVAAHAVAGREIVEAAGGKVVRVPTFGDARAQEALNSLATGRRNRSGHDG